MSDDSSIIMERAGRRVLYLWLNRNRMGSACFAYNISPDVLRALVSEMRRVGHGLERWIVPGLEYSSTGSTLRNDNPDTYAIVPELLESCRDLPVAEQWKRVRTNVFANAERAQSERHAQKTAPDKAAEEDTTARRPRRKPKAAPDKTTPRRATPRKTEPR